MQRLDLIKMPIEVCNEEKSSGKTRWQEAMMRFRETWIELSMAGIEMRIEEKDGFRYLYALRDSEDKGQTLPTEVREFAVRRQLE